MNGNNDNQKTHEQPADKAITQNDLLVGANIKQVVYSHGGSRIYVKKDGRRQLIADTYLDQEFSEKVLEFIKQYFD